MFLYIYKNNQHKKKKTIENYPLSDFSMSFSRSFTDGRKIKKKILMELH